MTSFTEHLSSISGVSHRDIKNRAGLAGCTDLRNRTYRNLVSRELNANFLDFSGSTFIDCKFVCFTTLESDFSNCVFKNCTFDGDVFNKCSFKECSFKECEFIDTYMSSKFVNSNLRFSTFSNTDCTTSYFQQSTNLTGADLSGAYLDDANLLGAVICDANLKGTCLDPTNEPNQEGSHRFVYGDTHNSDNRIGFRTACSPIVGRSEPYVVGNTYEAPVFSTSDKECHPGLYLYPYPGDVVNWMMPSEKSSMEILSVEFNKEDLHKVGKKYRVKKFTVNECFMELEARNKNKEFVR